MKRTELALELLKMARQIQKEGMNLGRGDRRKKPGAQGKPGSRARSGTIFDRHSDLMYYEILGQLVKYLSKDNEFIGKPEGKRVVSLLKSAHKIIYPTGDTD